jgi:hypothetical protein
MCTFHHRHLPLPLLSGQYAELVDDTAKTYIAALCPSGTYSARNTTGVRKTIKTGCDTLEAGQAGNTVGLASPTGDVCKPGTYAAKGAATCLPVSGFCGHA